MDSPTISRAIQSDEDVLLASNCPKRRAGRKKFKETRHPVYRGVRRRNSDKWVCEVREPIKQKRIWLGTYPTPEMAARAHDVAARAFRGQTACLNFADSVWRLPEPVSMDADDIKRAAVEAAERFRPRSSCEEVGAGGGDRSMAESERFSGGGGDLCVSEGLRMGGWEWDGFPPSPLPWSGWSSVSWNDQVESDVELELWSY